MNRLTISEHLFSLAGFVRLLPGRIEDTCNRIGCALERVGGRLRGCGCTASDPEMCRGEWCECHCHDVEITARTLNSKAN